MSAALDEVVDGSTEPLEAQIMDENSTPQNPIYVDPDSQTVTLYDDDGTLVTTIESSSGQIIRDGQGMYHVLLTMSSNSGEFELGRWMVLWVANYQGRVWQKQFFFNLVPTVPAKTPDYPD